MKFNHIGIISKTAAESVEQTLTTLLSFLKKQKYKVFVDEKNPINCTKHVSQFSSLYQQVSRQKMAQLCDLVIVVGGDGTLLNAVRSLLDAQVPVLGINVGRLGFLADISPDELEHALNEILNGCYRQEKRILLEACVRRNNEIVFKADAFNDVVVHIRDVARIIEFETQINKQFVSHQRADGMVISTPTGSTAYALSAGGPILHATLDAITLVPISPHTLSSRPLVVDADSEIDILICNTKNEVAQVTCDGHSSTNLLLGDHIIVKRKAKKITLLHPKNHNYFEILRTKLHWNKYS